MSVEFFKSSRFHLIMMFVWAALVIPTLLIWRESILWVAFMSLYANFVGHFGAYEAACSVENQENT